MTEKYPNSPEAQEGIVEALAKGAINTTSAKKTMEMRDQIRASIENAGEFLSAREKEAFRARMEALRATDLGDLNYLQSDIKKTIEQSQALVRQLDTNLEGSGLSDQIKNAERKFFLSLPLKEKKAYILKRIEDLRTLAADLGDEKFNDEDLHLRLDEMENPKLAPAEILARRENHERDYRQKLEKNAVFFRKASRAKYIASFKLLSLKKQAEWLDKFETSELPERQELQTQFEQFSARHQELYPNFAQLSRKEKKEAIAKLEKLLVEEARVIISNPALKRHLSPETAKGYLLYIEGKSLDGGDLHLSIKSRENALRFLRPNIENEAELSHQFEKFPPLLQSQHRHFYMLDYLGKEALLKTMKELDGERAGREASYESELEKAFHENIISEGTMNSYLKEFKELQTAREQEYYQSQFESQMLPRRELLNQWMSLPAEIREPHQKEFDKGSGSQRQELYNKLRPAPATVEEPPKPAMTVEKPEVLQLRMQAEAFEAKEDFERALLCYESILEVEPDDRLARARVKMLESHLSVANAKQRNDENPAQISPEQATHIIQNILNGEGVKTDRRHLAIQQAAIELQAQSERLNIGSSAIESRNDRLDGVEQELNKQLIDGFGMTLIDGMATDIHTFDLDKLKQSGSIQGEYAESKWLQTELQSPGIGGHDVQLVNSQGEALSATQAEQSLQEHRLRRADHALSQALALAKAQLGQSLNDATVQLLRQTLLNVSPELDPRA